MMLLLYLSFYEFQQNQFFNTFIYFYAFYFGFHNYSIILYRVAIRIRESVPYTNRVEGPKGLPTVELLYCHCKRPRQRERISV